MDLGIGEFKEVGDTVKQFASDDATVVVGTVIDPEMSQELRVTVVATGLGQGAAASEEEPMRVVRPAPPLEPDYRDLDKPAVHRRTSGDVEPLSDEETLEVLDVPAFLRRQAN